MRSIFNKLGSRLVDAVQDHIKRWLKPNTHSLAVGATADLTRGKADFVVENALQVLQVRLGPLF